MAKLTSSRRGQSLVIAGILAAAASGWTAYKSGIPDVTPAAIHRAVDKGITPPAVKIAMALAGPWEGMRTEAYLDPIGIPTICRGETMIGGKPVRLGMKMTVEQCEAIFARRMTYDFYLPLVDKVQDFVTAPDSVQGAFAATAYNVGVGTLVRPTSTPARYIREHKYPETCASLTAYNRAAGRVWRGLVNRREMGDKTRVGEAEACLSGIAP